MTITEIDPFDDAAFDAWHATYAAAEQHGRGEWSSDWLLEESRAAKQARLPSHEVHVFALVEAGEAVAVAELELPLLDNPELAWGKVHTHPRHRRRGHGGALLAHLEERAARAGRTRFVTETAYPWDAPADGAGHPDADFLTRRGFVFGIGDVQRVLDLPVPGDLLASLAASAAPHHTAYALRSFAGPVPEEHVADYAALCAAVSTEAPTGGLDLEPETADVAAFRAVEELQARQGRTRHATVAVAPDGSLAGYTDLVTSEHDPGRAYQWGTLVRREHRGHRLGLAVKVANILHLQARRPDINVVRTWNAETNAPMVGVNRAMGFRAVDRLGEFQKMLTAP
ncbi:GNAT family N-acetyltransferase [Nocardioides sp. JQ2195]|uniref:GNAT family N-acetyltransferase n=1 Tax=Nocardioides sp. JQ2195 TaxID=2592334 RepID=UPI00143E4AAD|nr:GNAT family N-acetyltransferase [Nocardioides sp. JQ2195]QIX25793.1 GNAT family N-acetyltransferase [Nocardioides sp. JQ2195]